MYTTAPHYSTSILDHITTPQPPPLTHFLHHGTVILFHLYIVHLQHHDGSYSQRAPCTLVGRDQLPTSDHVNQRCPQPHITSSSWCSLGLPVWIFCGTHTCTHQTHMSNDPRLEYDICHCPKYNPSNIIINFIIQGKLDKLSPRTRWSYLQVCTLWCMRIICVTQI